MQHSNYKEKQKSPCSTQAAAVPELITCPKCGDEMEIWSDEDETLCLTCRHKFFKKESILH